MENIITNLEEAKRSCYDLGRQHSAYGSQPLKIAYWEEFTLTMMATLEEGYPQVEKDELKAWHTFLHFINENMIDGYHDALPYSNKAP
ncbi:unnamed protein product [Caenorhabditis auriculariae]|uniref:Globin domain-containing protein n=1 Tax=Caenorhabditis auriculariae TaxID=2777116 RepID=A0A8S1HUW8_9PELO|nr:unnamed protein product [Caenorhabditis auriculariae]